MILPPSPTGEIWILKILAEIVLLMLLAWRGLLGRYIGLGVYLSVAVVKSVSLLVAMQTPVGYYPAWTRWQWISIAAYLILTIECLHLMARHFRGISKFAVGLFAVLGCVALLAALIVANVGHAWWSPEVRRMAGWSRYYGTACVAIMAMARLFFSAYRQVQMARNTTSVVASAMTLMIASAVGHSVKLWWLSDLLVVGVPLLVFARLSLTMSREGEEARIPPPADPEEMERWRRESEEKQRQIAERIRLRIKLR